MKMKRLMAVLLCTLTVAALASCTPKQPHTDANATTTATTTAATTKKADVQTTQGTVSTTTAATVATTTAKPEDPVTEKTEWKPIIYTKTTAKPTTTVPGLGENDFAKNPKYKLVWSDEFNGTKLNTNNWVYETGFVRNNEPQCYTKYERNVKVENGSLALTAIKEYYDGEFAVVNDWGSQHGQKRAANYTSGSINTSSKHDWKYGVFEMRAKMPDTNCKAAWPAFWTMGTSINGDYWPRTGEIDILESYGTNRRKYGATVHWFNQSKGQQASSWMNEYKQGSMDYTHPENLSNDWHVIGMEWDEKQIRFYFNSVTVGVFDITDPNMDEFHRKHYAMLDLALTSSDIGKTSAADFPFSYYVDYVRVYQKR
ncbi:MAG: glycoside hydrolase family 16 protein [Clostridia bacterium]|nr:glycoside hydrolase family 16 protein [Clostridia bacterium]